LHAVRSSDRAPNTIGKLELAADKVAIEEPALAMTF
jgi:hypothetical protein